VGESQSRPFQLSFNRFLRGAFQGSRVTSDGGLILVRELDERFGLSGLIGKHLVDSCTGHNRAVQIMEKDFDSWLTFFQFDPTSWTVLRTTNPIERLNKEFKRRTKAMQVTGGEISTYRCLVCVAQTMEYRWSFHPFSQWNTVDTQNAAGPKRPWRSGLDSIGRLAYAFEQRGSSNRKFSIKARKSNRYWPTGPVKESGQARTLSMGPHLTSLLGDERRRSSWPNLSKSEPKQIFR